MGVYRERDKIWDKILEAICLHNNVQVDLVNHFFIVGKVRGDIRVQFLALCLNPSLSQEKLLTFLKECKSGLTPDKIIEQIEAVVTRVEKYKK